MIGCKSVHHVGGLPVHGTFRYNMTMSSLENEVDFLSYRNFQLTKSTPMHIL